MTVISNRVVMVTGASGNLGMAVVQKFYAAGAQLILLDRSPEKFLEKSGEIQKTPERYFLQNADVTDPHSMDSVVSKSMDRFGGIHILVNTVGGFRAGTPLHETTLETFNFMFKLNVLSIFNASKAVIPVMIRQKQGSIVNIAARPGLKGTKNSSAYSAAKSGVIRLTESMASELKHQGINVNCIIPGTIDTPQNRSSMPNSDFEKWVKPEQLAEVIVFLTSDKARNINGAAIPVLGRS